MSDHLISNHTIVYVLCHNTKCSVCACMSLKVESVHDRCSWFLCSHARLESTCPTAPLGCVMVLDHSVKLLSQDTLCTIKWASYWWLGIADIWPQDMHPPSAVELQRSLQPKPAIQSVHCLLNLITPHLTISLCSSLSLRCTKYMYIHGIVHA